MKADRIVFPAVAGVTAAAWVVLAVGRGWFWRARVDEHIDEEAKPNGRRERGDARAPRIEAVVPARDEAETIGAALASLVAQRYDGAFAVTLVDDASSDETPRIARDIAMSARTAERTLDVIPGRALQRPWTGKLNALDTGVAAVRERRGEPDYWLFTDADIAHDPENVAALVAKARRDGLALVSLMVRLRCESGWERLLVPAFVFFFQKLYPFAWSNDPRRATAAAAGGCVLVRADALERIGGLRAVADRLIDDCALADAVKRSGGRMWIGLTGRAESIRPYGDLGSLWRMVKRTAFTQLGRSYFVTLGATFGMIALYLAPPALAIRGIARRDARTALPASFAWLAMSALYVPTLRSQRRPFYDAVTLPLAALLYTLMTIDSALAHARGNGGVWKGRAQAAVAHERAPREPAMTVPEGRALEPRNLPYSLIASNGEIEPCRNSFGTT